MRISIIDRLIGFILLILLFLSSCTNSNPFWDNLSKDQIFSLVQDNHEFLQECIDTGDFEKAKQIEGIKDVYSSEKGSYIEFYCGGTGLASSSSYYGFYFSPDDVPLAVAVIPTEKLVPQDDGYGYNEPKGDNKYYTERILENWFYYEAHY